MDYKKVNRKKQLQQSNIVAGKNCMLLPKNIVALQHQRTSLVNIHVYL